jgi:hypothetical protein
VIVGGPGRAGGAVRAQSALTLNGVTISNSSAADGNSGTDPSGNHRAPASVSFKIVKR